MTTSVLVGLLVSLITSLGMAGGAGAVTSGTEARSVSSAGGPPLVLEQQTATVVAGQAFDLQLQAEPGALAPSQLGLSVTVYACLSSVSGFDQSVTGATPSGAVIASTHSPLLLSGLPHLADGGVDLSMPVIVGTSPASASGFTIGLTSAGGQCGLFPAGVYPVRVQLVNTVNGQSLGGFTTHLVYANAPADTQKLRFALVLPVGTTFTPAHHPTTHELLAHPSSALATPSAPAIDGVVQTVARVAAHPSVPLTLEVSPQTTQALAASDNPAVTAAAATLATLAAEPQHQFVRSPYTSVNAVDLVDSGLASELSAQIDRGSQVFAAATRPDGPVSASADGSGVWATDDGLDADTLSQLQADGYSQVVVPATTVTAPPTNGSTAEPFVLTSSKGTAVTAVASSPDLAARFTGSPGNPVLAAHQVIAELAQIYYEKPNDTTARAVAVLPPVAWSDNPSFVDALLAGLTADPIILPVTVDSLFSTVPTAPCRSTCRSTAVNGGAALPVAAIRSGHQRVLSFAAAAPGAHTTSTQLGDLVLAAQSDALRPSQQAAVLRTTGRALDAQLAQLSVAGDRTITLTSRQGTLPIDVVSSALYPVRASLTVTSDKLLFPNGSTQWTKPDAVDVRPGTNIIDVPCSARSSGQFTVDVTIRSPQGGLVLSHGEISVRSTATSVVGVILTVGALVVLAVWWFRTSRKRRVARRHDEAGTAPDAPEPG